MERVVPQDGQARPVVCLNKQTEVPKSAIAFEDEITNQSTPANQNKLINK